MTKQHVQKKALRAQNIDIHTPIKTQNPKLDYASKRPVKLKNAPTK